MTPERWRRIDELFHSAIALDPARRPSFLADACSDDEGLLREVQSLIAAHEQKTDFIEAPADDVAAALLDGQIHPRAGERLGRYEMTSLIGAGGMGEVYLARDTVLGRQVALKLLPAQVGGNADRVRRFEREARAASALNHPNIVTIHEIAHAGSSHFIATEFIDGETLRHHMAGSRLPLRETIDIVTQVAAALTAAHAAGIVHRDIKPENVMLRRDGIVKVLDFGLAKLTSSPPAAGIEVSNASAATTPGVILGTARYMSPEQVRGRDVDSRTDIWSLGVMLYEMIAGQRPFGGDTSSDLIVSILDKPPAPLSHDLAVPAELERIARKALDKDPDKRYQTAAEMASDLRNLARELETSGNIAVAARRRRTVPLAVGLTVVLAMAAVFVYSRMRGGAIDSVAVLPFANVSGEPDTAFLADGISDSVINNLSRLPDMKVISFNAVQRYKGQTIEPRSVGKELRVEAVLMGRMLQRGQDITVFTELIDVRDDRQLWGERYDGSLSDVLSVQNQISHDIAQRLRQRLSGEDEKRLAKRDTESSEAYELYLKGRYLFDKRTAVGIKQSIEYLQQAIRKDPNYALAYAGLANSYTPSDLVLPPRETMAQAKAAARRALEIDDSLAQAHTAEARVLLFYDWNGPAAEAELVRAMELNPNYAEAHHMYSHYLMNQGQAERSLVEARRALEIDPLDALLNLHMGWTYLYARQYDRAIEQLQRTIALDSGFFLAYMFLGQAYEQKRMYRESIAAYGKAIDLESGGKQTLAYLGHVYAVSGKRDEAMTVLRELEELYERKAASAYDLAVVYCGLGENDLAVEWLTKAFQDRTGGLLLLKAEPVFDPVRTDPRFTALLRGLNLSG